MALAGWFWFGVLFRVCCLMVVLRLFSLFFVVSVGLVRLLGVGVGGVVGTC